MTLQKVIADAIKLQTTLKEHAASVRKDLNKAQNRLKSFRNLAKDKKCGKWYVSHVRDECATIERLEKYINQINIRLERIEQQISELEFRV